MCTGAELLIGSMIAGTAASTGTAIASAVSGAPKIPAMPQAAQSPTADAFRKKNAAAMLPGAALSGASFTGAGAGPSQNVGTSTLLGQ